MTTAQVQRMKVASELATMWTEKITSARAAATAEACKKAGCKKEELAQAILGISQKRFQRFKRRSGVAPSLLYKAEVRLADRLRMECPLRRSQSSWAGGAKFRVIIARRKNRQWVTSQHCDAIVAESGLTVSVSRAWSDNGKWSGNETHHTLYLIPSDTFRTVGGLFTILSRHDKSLAVPCKWYEQARGFDIREKRGWLIAGHYHVEATDAITTAAAAIAAYEAAKAKKAAKETAKLTAKGVMRQYGFCEPGVRNFCELNGIAFDSRLTREELAAIVERNPENSATFGAHLCKMGIRI